MFITENFYEHVVYILTAVLTILKKSTGDEMEQKKKIQKNKIDAKLNIRTST